MTVSITKEEMDWLAGLLNSCNDDWYAIANNGEDDDRKSANEDLAMSRNILKKMSFAYMKQSLKKVTKSLNRNQAIAESLRNRD